MANGDQKDPNGTSRRANAGWFTKGSDPRRRGNGRKVVTPEQRKLQAMTRAEVEAAFQRLLGPALQRLEELVAKGADGDSLKALALVLDRAVGPVPSQAYLAAQINATSGNPNGVKCVQHTQADVIAAMQRYIAKNSADAVTIDVDSASRD